MITLDKKYRHEIDGLRAIAVLAVVIFHLNPIYLPGGFVGVDIFFVISGYLITNIIYTEMLAGKFTYKRFYERRIKRILPIFYIVVFAVIAVGYFILSPSEYKSLSNSAIAANSFLANFRFMLTGNYFQEENLRPLLHLWSLAVEEQFYFIWPSLLLLLSNCKRLRLFQILAFIIVLSFIGAEIAARDLRWTTMSYYMLPTRMGELLLGAILVFTILPERKLALEVVSLLGFLLMFYGIIFIDSESVFPGLNSFIPCLGCAMIIASGSETRVAKLLSIRPLLFFGLISYSLYLWHWPFIVFYKSYFLQSTLSPIIAIVIFGLMVLLSWLTTEYIENKFRRSKLSFRLTIVNYLLIPMALLFIVSFYIRHHSGLPERFGLNEKMTVTETIRCDYDELGTCYISSHGDSSVLLLGDSHAGHFSNFFHIIGDELQIKIIRLTSSGCSFENTKFISRNCEEMKSKIEVLAKKVDKIVIVKRIENLYRNESDFKDYIAFIEGLNDYQKPILVLGQVPRNLNNRFIDVYIKSKSSNTPELINTATDPSVAAANEALFESTKRLDNVEFIDFATSFCINGACRLFDESDKPLYFDDDHLTAYGSEWLANKVLQDKKYSEFINLLKK